VPPGNGKIIIIIDSDVEEEAREETAVDANVMPSTAAMKPLTLAASPADADEDPEETPDDTNGDLALGQDAGKSSDGGDEAGSP
jgi:hypothetical protein